MDTKKVGKAIAFLRKKNGYTQRDLASRLGVSDKAVSKWERGLGLPDISIIRKIAILLDTDTDSLLLGDIVHHNIDWTGLLILPPNKYGINIGTVVYDKPIANFLLGYFMLMGIKKITVMAEETNIRCLKENFGLGENLGIKLSYNSQLCISREDDDEQRNVMVIVGMPFIYGVDQTRFFQKAMLQRDKCLVLSIAKKTDLEMNRLYYNADKRIVYSEDGEKLKTQYEYSPLPFYFCPINKINKLKFSDFLNDRFIFDIYDDELYTVILDRGFVDISLDTWDDITEASNFIKIVQKACGMQIYCIEEIAWRRGMITKEKFRQKGIELQYTPYGQYILEISKY